MEIWDLVVVMGMSLAEVYATLLTLPGLQLLWWCLSVLKYSGLELVCSKVSTSIHVKR